MVNRMAKNTMHLVSLNGEYLFSAAHGGMYAPLRTNEHSAKKIQKALETKTPDKKSCIKKLAAIWCDGKFMISAEFMPFTKCTASLLNTPSCQTKAEMCSRNLCNGKCTDKFMRDIVAKNILPELYNTKQK